MWNRAALLILLVATLALAACGDESPDRKSLLSSSKAAELRSMLDGVEQKVADGDCDGAQSTALALQEQVDALPASTDSSLRDALGRGTSRLQTLVEQKCEPAPPVTTTPTTPEQGPTGPEEGQGEEQKKEKQGKAKGQEEKQGSDEDGTQTAPQEETGGSEG